MLFAPKRDELSVNQKNDHQAWEEAADAYIRNGLSRQSFRNLLRVYATYLKGWALRIPSRDDLLVEVIRRHFRSMEEGRTHALIKARERSGGTPLPVEDIIDARLLPVAEDAVHSIIHGGRFQRGLARMFSESPAFKRRLIAEVYTDSVQIFLDEFAKSIPGLCREELTERFWMSHCSILGCLGMLDKHYDPSSPTASEQAMWKQIHLLRDAMCALFRAPPRPEFHTAMIHLQEDGRQWQVSQDQITCIHSDGDYSTLYLADGTSHYLRRSMKEWEEILPSAHFLRIHRSWIINIKSAQLNTKTGYVHIQGHDPIPVSRRKNEIVKERLVPAAPPLG